MYILLLLMRLNYLVEVERFDSMFLMEIAFFVSFQFWNLDESLNLNGIKCFCFLWIQNGSVDQSVGSRRQKSVKAKFFLWFSLPLFCHIGSVTFLKIPICYREKSPLDEILSNWWTPSVQKVFSTNQRCLLFKSFSCLTSCRPE